MRAPRNLALVSAALVAGAAGAALAGPSVPTTPATPTAYASDRVAATYKTFDGHTGKERGTAKWHWTSTGGNCCEVYVSSTARGDILEYGGSLPYVSSDAGKSWKQITFTTPLVNGEGAIVAGPKGDVFGIGWDPYTGDHLQGVKYTAATNTWAVAEAPLKTPVFDREWITYVKGPFSDGLGGQSPFLTLVRGGTATKQIELISTDGLSYTTASDPNGDVASYAGEPVKFTIPTVKNPDADYWQPNPGTYTLPLNAGGVLLFNNGEDDFGADAARLNPSTLKWEPVDLPFTPKGVVRQDSRGWLTMVTQQGADVVVALSSNGGVTWKSTTLVLPESHPKSAQSVDVKVNGKLGQAVIATRANDKAGRGQDVVWRVDIKGAQPKLLQSYLVGLGNAPSAIGLVAGAAADRMDFPSIALLPSGKIAVSFQDATTPRHVSSALPSTGAVLNPSGGHNPAMAILD